MPEIKKPQLFDPTTHPYLAKITSLLGGDTPGLPLPAIAGSVAPKAVIGAVGAVPKAISLIESNPDSLEYLTDAARSYAPRSLEMMKQLGNVVKSDLNDAGIVPLGPGHGADVGENSRLMSLVQALANHFYGAGGPENR